MVVRRPEFSICSSPNDEGTGMTRTRYCGLHSVMAALVLVVVACGGSDASSDAEPTETTLAPSGVDDSDADEGAPSSDSGDADSPAPSDDDETDRADDGDGGSGGGVILADLCSGGQPVNGAISLDDLVGFGLLSSTDATVEGSGAYDAFAYETFGFLCNIEEVGGTENFVTIGLSAGSDTWDLALEQGDAVPERMGDWEVIVGSNWLSPLTMRFTDADGNQDSLFALWVPGDGSIPDTDTLERLMRPLGEAIAAGVTMDIPRS